MKPTVQSVQVKTLTSFLFKKALNIDTLHYLLLLNVVLECAIGRVQEHHGLKLYGNHQLLAYADDVIIVGKDVNTIQEKKALPDANKEVGLKVNPETAKYMLISHYQKAGKGHGTKIVNMSH
jgi:hypothetical protein